MTERMRAAAPPRRVLYVINDLLLGGAQRVLLDQAAGLDRARFTPEVASLEIVPNGGIAPAFRDAGIPLHLLRGAGESKLFAIGRLHALMGRFAPGIVHTHLAVAGIAGRCAARAHGVGRIVTTLHNLSDWEELRASPVRALDRHTLAFASAVVTVSDAVRRAAEQVSPALSPRLFTVRNGVRLDTFTGATTERAAARAHLGLEHDAFVVGSVARLDLRKGLDTLIEAAALATSRVPALQVMIVGDGPERARLEALVRARGLEGRVTLRSHEPRVRGHLAAMDVFAAPSRTEGLGVAIIEALAAGLPVLASRVGGIPEVMEAEATAAGDGCGMLLPPADPAAWAEAIVRAASDTTLRQRWAHAAPMRARSFGLDVSVRALEAVYDPGAADARPLDFESSSQAPSAKAA